MSVLYKRFPNLSRVLNLYPRQYRSEYADEILQTTADMLDNAPSQRLRLSIWLHLAFDLPFNITKQQLLSAGSGGLNQSPSYIKKSGAVSGLLLLPFFCALLVNSLDKVLFNHTLYHSWLWSVPVLTSWVLYFPLLALLVAGLGYVHMLSRGNSSIWVHESVNFKHIWPVLVPIAASLGILLILIFHDSFRCWVQTPTHFFTHVSSTLQCTNNNRVGIKEVLFRAFKP